jgi:hypothetical protein
MRMACPEATQTAKSGQFVRLRTLPFPASERAGAKDKVKTRPRKAPSAPPLHPSDHHTPVDSLTATKRRPCLWRCLGT